MLRLSTRRQPFWLDFPAGVRVRFEPVSIADIIVARSAAVEVLKAGGEDAATRAAVAFTCALAHSGIVQWEGVAGDDGKPAAPTREAVDAFLDQWPMFDAVDRLYVGPALIADAEKNASSPAPNGTSVGAPAIARLARKRARPAHTP